MFFKIHKHIKIVEKDKKDFLKEILFLKKIKIGINNENINVNLFKIAKTDIK